MTEYWSQLSEAYLVFFFAHVLLLLIWPVVLLLEKKFPVHQDLRGEHYWFNWKVSLFNWLIAPLFSAMVVSLTLLFSSYLSGPFFEYPVVALRTGVDAFDVGLQLVTMFMIACFINDFSYYWWHRWQHKIPFLWELHKVHHSEERLNMTTMPRSHFLEQAGQAMVRGLSVGLLFDLSQAGQTTLAIIAVGILPPVWNFFIHSNVRFDVLQGLPPFFSTPQYHRVHHSNLPEHQDRNFAVFLPLFDIVFGSYYKPAVDEYPPTGLSSGEKIDTLWEAQTGPLKAWITGSYRNRV